MRYSITVSAVPDQKTAKILARYITSRGDQTSFSELIDLLQTEEYRYAHNVTKSEMVSIQDQLSSLDVKIRVEEVPEIVPPEPHHISQLEDRQIPAQEVAKEDTVTKANSRPPKLPDQQEPIEKKRLIKRAHLIVSLSTILLITLFLTTVLLNYNSEKRFSIDEPNRNNSGTTTAGSGSGSAPSEQPFDSGETSQDRASREALSSAEKQCVSSGINTEKFYQFAIDYNPDNLDAWFGLLNCYRITKRSDDANRIITEMRERFGNNILEPMRYLQEFGNREVTKLQSPNGSLVYQSNASSVNLLYGELFRITRRISAAGTVQSLTILAKMRDGTGIFLTISLGSCIEYYNFIEQGTFQEMQ